VLKFAADENFSMHVVKGVLRRHAEIDIVRVQDVGLRGASDSSVIQWSASEGRMLLTHDANTLSGFAYARVAQGLPMCGVIEVPLRLSVRSAIEDILLLAECSVEGEWEGQVIYLPLK